MPMARCCSCRSKAAYGFCTEFGVIDIEPGEIAVMPRGVKFRVELHGGPARGYLCENYGRRFYAARARTYWRELPGQSARFPNAGCGL